MSIFQPLEVVSRDSDSQLQVCDFCFISFSALRGNSLLWVLGGGGVFSREIDVEIDWCTYRLNWARRKSIVSPLYISASIQCHHFVVIEFFLPISPIMLT